MLYIRLCCGQQTNSSEPDRDVSFPQLPTVWVGSESVNSSALLLPNTLYALYQGLGLHFILLQERFYLFYFVKFLLSLQEQNQSQLIKKKKKKKPLEISLADQEMLVEYIFNFSKWLHIHRVPL